VAITTHHREIVHARARDERLLAAAALLVPARRHPAEEARRLGHGDPVLLAEVVDVTLSLMGAPFRVSWQSYVLLEGR
jgi:hypothetical protein